MKARVKEIGKEFKVRGILTPWADAYAIEEVDIFFDESDQVELLYREEYWERLRHEYAGMAMQGLLQNEAYCHYEEDKLAYYASLHAHALVEKLKEERNEKV